MSAPANLVDIVARAPVGSAGRPGRRTATGTGTVRRSIRRLRAMLDTRTTAGRQRVVGLLLFLAMAGPFFLLNRFPKLDTIRGDVDTAIRAAGETDGAGCVGQGFCFGGSPVFDRWWEFSTTYLRVVTVGMLFAFLVAGLATTFLFPRANVGGFARRGVRGSLQGLTVGPAMTLCSACIVPVAGSFRERGASVEATIAIAQGSSTLSAPAILMTLAVFGSIPILAASRLGMSIAAALAIGPFVALAVRGRRHPSPPVAEPLDAVCATEPPRSWGMVLREGVPAWLVSSGRLVRRLGPVMVVAGFASGMVVQMLTPETASKYLGEHAGAVVTAATLGVLVNVPLMFEIPLVAGLIALGMGAAPAAALLFTAAGGGPITFWGLSKHLSVRGVLAYAAANWAIGVAGGLVVLAAVAVLGA